MASDAARAVRSRASRSQPLRVIGMMSGTSLDGIDAAWLETDGEADIRPGRTLGVPYDDATRDLLRRATAAAPNEDRAAPSPLVREAEAAMTRAHAAAARRLIDVVGAAPDLIGFHGQTLLHRPDLGWTWQIGDGALLAAATGVSVIYDFRSADMAAGGQGAPLASLYHAALARGGGASLPRPVAALNLGGVANVTWIGAADGGDGGAGAGAAAANADEPALIAFDTGPANGLMDDWAAAHTGARCDVDGRLAARGQVDAAALARLLDAPFFDRAPPKSLDRADFTLDAVAGCAPADGAATLLAFTVESVARALRWFPAPPRRWIACGGGRRNPTLMAALRARLGDVVPAEEVGWNADFLEAQAFAWLAARSLRGLPLTSPLTTGARVAASGGRRADPPRAAATG